MADDCYTAARMTAQMSLDHSIRGSVAEFSTRKLDQKKRALDDMNPFELESRPALGKKRGESISSKRDITPIAVTQRPEEQLPQFRTSLNIGVSCRLKPLNESRSFNCKPFVVRPSESVADHRGRLKLSNPNRTSSDCAPSPPKDPDSKRSTKASLNMEKTHTLLSQGILSPQTFIKDGKLGQVTEVEDEHKQSRQGQRAVTDTEVKLARVELGVDHRCRILPQFTRPEELRPATFGVKWRLRGPVLSQFEF